MASTNRKKLIEVALPLEAINAASAREKSIRHGHPSTLHLWWARRPLAAARAVIFSQMVDDPSEYIDELLTVAENRQRAEEELERRRTEWAKLKALHEQALRDGNTSAVGPGAEASLRNCAADLERERLFGIIKQLVLWESTANEVVLSAASEEIWKSWRRTCEDNKDHARAADLFNAERLPSFHDPFAGGGTLPLEAQRLGLEAYASDLNPVAVLINKAMIEIPPKFAGWSPVNPEVRKQQEMAHKEWHGIQGLTEDVRYYGKWMRDEAEKRIGHLYPKIEITAEMAEDRPDLKKLVGRRLTVIAWIWARTVKSPNPAFNTVDVPLASTFVLSSKPGKETYIHPEIKGADYRFTVKVGKTVDFDNAKNGTKLVRANFRCILSGTAIPGDYIKAEGQAGRMGSQLMATVAEGDHGRVYLAPTRTMEEAAREAVPTWRPPGDVPARLTGGTCVPYGLKQWGDLFTPRQLLALITFSDLIREARELVKKHSVEVGIIDDGLGFEAGGTGATAYADAMAVYFGCAVDKSSVYWSSLCPWLNQPKNEIVGNTFGRQAFPMMWDYAEANPFSDSGGNIEKQVEYLSKAMIASLCACGFGSAMQLDAGHQTLSTDKVVSTDPPYYDNIAYAELSEFFYVWLRRALKEFFPDLFATMAVPKAEELVAASYRHGNKQMAEEFFLSGMTHAMQRLSAQSHVGFPVTIYYAFKQSETEIEGTASTGWETFLDALIRAGFAIGGTWPMRTERPTALKTGTNALASSIILVCRPRATDSPITTRREFLAALKLELPIALAHLQRGNIAPVDLAQAALGPGMAVYTRYSKVLDAEGRPLSVRDALALINQSLDEVLAEQEGDFDADTRWALTWFDDVGFAEGRFGKAEQLSKSKNTSVEGMVEAKIVSSKAGKVRLLRPQELPPDWDPLRDSRLTVWEVVHHLVRRLESGGETAAAEVVAVLGGVAEVARELAYRLYTICERKKRAQEALSYNGLVQSWPEIIRLAREQRVPQAEQTPMFQ